MKQEIKREAESEVERRRGRQGVSEASVATRRKLEIVSGCFVCLWREKKTGALLSCVLLRLQLSRLLQNFHVEKFTKIEF